MINLKYVLNQPDFDKNWHLPVVNLLIGLLVCSYLVQVFSPLRLDTDATYYLSVAASHADGRGLFYRSVPTVFPPGYSLIVSALDQLGLASSGSMIGINFFFLILGLFVSKKIMQTQFELTELAQRVILMLTLSSFVFVKYFPMPRSEIAFFGVLIPSLWLLTRIRRKNGTVDITALVGALIMTGIAISIRSIGIALLPALVLALLPREILSVRDLLENKVRLVFLLLIVGLGFIFTVWVLKNTHYYGTLVEQYAGISWIEELAKIFRYKLNEFGQILVNIPGGRIPKLVSPLTGIVGLVFLAFLIRGIWNRRSRFSPIDAFLITYAAVLFIWPGNNPRFWLPVLPFLFGVLLEICWPYFGRRFFRSVALFYCGVILVTGSLAHGYSTRLTFSGERFAERYGDGTLTPTYESALNGSTLSDKVNLQVFRILLRYEDRVSNKWDISQYPPY